jgi:hypothetical protein
MVREIATSGPDVFRNQPKLSLEISGDFSCGKRKTMRMVGSNSLPDPLLYPYTTATLCVETKYKIEIDEIE